MHYHRSCIVYKLLFALLLMCIHHPIQYTFKVTDFGSCYSHIIQHIDQQHDSEDHGNVKTTNDCGSR